MLIPKPKQKTQSIELTESQKVATQFLPKEQIEKFFTFPHLLEKELENEAREPEIENTLKDLFNALHEHNTPKLLKTLQGDKKRLFYAYKKQLETAPKLTKQEAKILNILQDKEISLLGISLLR